MVYYQSNLQHKIYGKPLNLTATPQDDTLFVSVVKANDHTTQAKNELAEIFPSNDDNQIYAKLPGIYNPKAQNHESTLYITSIGLILYTKAKGLPSKIKYISYSQISNLGIDQTETEAIHRTDDTSEFTSNLYMTVDGENITFQVKNIWSKSKYVNLKPLLYQLIMLTQKGCNYAQ